MFILIINSFYNCHVWLFLKNDIISKINFNFRKRLLIKPKINTLINTYKIKGGTYISKPRDRSLSYK